jgi:hypothetical protein
MAHAAAAGNSGPTLVEKLGVDAGTLVLRKALR